MTYLVLTCGFRGSFTSLAEANAVARGLNSRGVDAIVVAQIGGAS